MTVTFGSDGTTVSKESCPTIASAPAVHLNFDGEKIVPSSLPTELYSVFTDGERNLLTGTVGFVMLFSPLSANIYFPAISQLAQDYAVSTSLIYLTITSYLVLQGIAPVVFGDLADLIGRRPALIVMFGIYTAANIGLALQHDYAALVVLRMVQSLGCSAIVAVGYGIVADVAVPAQRGPMLGMAMIATNLGPAVVPLIGSAVLESLDWRWIFWLLTILGASVAFLILFVLPETSRNVIGNGARLPSPGRRPFVALLVPRLTMPGAARKLEHDSGAISPANLDEMEKRRSTPNPLRSLRILLFPDAAVVASLSGLFYLIYYCVQASISTTMQELYDLEDLQVGFCYPAIGGGVVAGGVTNGKILDRQFRKTAAGLGIDPKAVHGEALATFPVEEARLRSMVAWVPLSALLLAAYGWCLNAKTVS